MEKRFLGSKAVKVMDSIQVVKVFADIVVVVVEMSIRRLEMVEEVVEMSRCMVAEVMVVVGVEMSRYMVAEEMVEEVMVAVVVEMSRHRLEMAEEVVEMSRYMAEEELVGKVMVVVVEGML